VSAWIRFAETSLFNGLRRLPGGFLFLSAGPHESAPVLIAVAEHGQGISGVMGSNLQRFLFFRKQKNLMTEKVETGACFCGAIAAELHGDPFWICYDHDDDCRRAVGSPLSVWVGYRPDQFRLIRGAPKSFSKTKGVVRTFCPDCGTSIAH
jgi:Glutathione-dependent formaldehyde-activating enzyme